MLAALLALLATPWAAYHERRILRLGRQLTASELADAAAAGVTCPARLRILAVPAIPNPFGRAFRLLESHTSLCISRASGLTLRHGIFAVPPADQHRETLVHEFAHTRQYESFRSLFAFLHRYIGQCLRQGYHQADFERDARQVASRVCAKIP
ncbi:hypothetical protein BH23VER1_BH23VER1_09670 [soil metagenome]